MEYAARLAEEARATSVDESVSAMLNDVLPSEDALDSAGFDPIEVSCGCLRVRVCGLFL